MRDFPFGTRSISTAGLALMVTALPGRAKDVGTPDGSPSRYARGCRTAAVCPHHRSVSSLTCAEAAIQRRSDYATSKLPPGSTPPAAWHTEPRPRPTKPLTHRKRSMTGPSTEPCTVTVAAAMSDIGVRTGAKERSPAPTRAGCITGHTNRGVPQWEPRLPRAPPTDTSPGAAFNAYAPETMKVPSVQTLAQSIDGDRPKNEGRCSAGSRLRVVGACVVMPTLAIAGMGTRWGQRPGRKVSSGEPTPLNRLRATPMCSKTPHHAERIGV